MTSDGMREGIYIPYVKERNKGERDWNRREWSVGRRMKKEADFRFSDFLCRYYYYFYPGV